MVSKVGRNPAPRTEQLWPRNLISVIAWTYGHEFKCSQALLRSKNPIRKGLMLLLETLLWDGVMVTHSPTESRHREGSLPSGVV